MSYRLGKAPTRSAVGENMTARKAISLHALLYGPKLAAINVRMRGVARGVLDVNMSTLPELLAELVSPYIVVACLAVMLNPLLWNLAARLEYNTRAISRFCRGPRKGIVALAVFILFNNLIRTSFVHYLMNKYSKWEILEVDLAIFLGYFFMVIGFILVLASAWRLGFYCTFLGDYFGILLDAKVTGFPFNIVDHPMYWGTFIMYCGGALQHASVIGFLMAFFVGLSYIITAKVEGPFTTMIYAKAQAKKL